MVSLLTVSAAAGAERSPTAVTTSCHSSNWKAGEQSAHHKVQHNTALSTASHCLSVLILTVSMSRRETTAAASHRSAISDCLDNSTTTTVHYNDSCSLNATDWSIYILSILITFKANCPFSLSSRALTTLRLQPTQMEKNISTLASVSAVILIIEWSRGSGLAAGTDRQLLLPFVYSAPGLSCLSAFCRVAVASVHTNMVN